MIYRTLPTSGHPLVELRPIAATDLQHWYEYLSLPLVYEHTSWNLSSLGDLASHVAGSTQVTPDSMFRLAISSRSSGQLVGTIGFHSIGAQDRRAELAYDLSPSIWGQGIASYAVALMTDWAHSDPGFTRVQATVLQSNARSLAVLERCGFHFEGRLQSYRMVRGKPGDFAMYAHIAPAESAA